MRTDFMLISIPIVYAFLSMLVYSSLEVMLYAGILAIITGAVAAVVVTTLGGIHIFGSGVDIKDFTVRMAFITTALTAFWGSYLVLSFSSGTVMADFPDSFKTILIAVLSMMYVFGLYLNVTGGSVSV